MTTINYKNKFVTLKSQQSVLNGLLDAGFSIPHACQAGACQSCKMQDTKGAPPPAAQVGLSQAEKTLGYFLSCMCTPTQDMTLSDAQSSTQYESQVLDITLLKAQVLRLRLSPVFDFMAGQYFTIWHNGTMARSYSIASLPSDNYIECHIKLIEGGAFSTHAHTVLKVGDTLSLQGPMGTCVYSPQSLVQPLLLAGIGTGLAPIYGIAKHALSEGHQGPIHLISGAKTTQGLYLTDELKALEHNHANLTVSFVVQNNPQRQGHVIEDDIYQFCKAQHPSTKGYEVYLCGAQSFVTKLKKQSFLLGANMPNIHADAFIACS